MKEYESGDEELMGQTDYVRSLKKSGFKFGLTVGEAFVAGIRDIGYKHTGTALDEFIDNSIQAKASKICVAFGYGSESKKPTSIAVIDDGRGMIPGMVRLAMIWGGTHRQDNRDGFGRYGYGLPSASVSQGRRFSVYSAQDSGSWYGVTLDLDSIKKGEYTVAGGEIIVPEPKSETPPDWVMKEIKDIWTDDGLFHGTIVVIDKLDRPTWKTTSSLQEKLLIHFGVTYRNYLRNINLTVAGKKVEPIDPLFTTPGCRFYDIDEDRAEALDPVNFDVKVNKDNSTTAPISVRFSYMPPTFASLNKKARARNKNENPRFNIMKDHWGIVFTRLGRQIDVVTKCPWTTFRINDRYWGVEVDFSPDIDEEFAITTSKQRVDVSSKIWDLLEQNGVYKAIEQLRRKDSEAKRKLKVTQETNEDKKRASEEAMEQGERFIRHPPVTEERRKRAEQAFEEEVKRRARKTGQDEKTVHQQMQLEYGDVNYKVEHESSPGAPFFRTEQLGGAKVLFINTSHRFFGEVYMGADSSPSVRASLEVLLFVIGDCQLDATQDGRVFYQTEILQWSTRLNVILDQLAHHVAADNKDDDD